MTTLAEAYVASVRSAGGRATVEQIKRYINDEFPGRWKATTVQQGATFDFVVNKPKAYIHFPSTPKPLYRNDDGTIELYDEAVHGPNVWAPPISDDEVTDVKELEEETSISLERDIEDHLVRRLDDIEKGLTLVDR